MNTEHFQDKKHNRFCLFQSYIQLCYKLHIAMFPATGYMQLCYKLHIAMFPAAGYIQLCYKSHIAMFPDAGMWC